jgi:hypothetical protein
VKTHGKPDRETATIEEGQKSNGRPAMLQISPAFWRLDDTSDTSEFVGAASFPSAALDVTVFSGASPEAMSTCKQCLNIPGAQHAVAQLFVSGNHKMVVNSCVRV